ncbi:MAG: acylneuraminate cytidylyltransferase [Candidatus Marinimicrobia bacterium]|nr:acylneuraminate cytidylyltransferase [Candidatus Neomarinimicrobiota bacterium]|tara:strand:+ start:85998 stop:86708 length:711 start_codon:yes stop_codon:yes gene_type:complete
MINELSVLAVILARGGSKGLPKKNILPLGGKPLIVWTIEAANKSKYIDRCIVSTDCETIADVCLHNGGEVPFMRDASLATDSSNSNEVIMDSIYKLDKEYDFVISLQPTSPLRETEDIDNALEIICQKNAQALVSVFESSKPVSWHHTLNDHGIIEPVVGSIDKPNRQDYKKTFLPNGAIFIARVEHFKHEKSFYSEFTLGYEMPIERSVDIDNKFDFLIASCLINIDKKSNHKFK